MQFNHYDTYNEINKNEYSAVSLIKYALELDNLEDLFYNDAEQRKFAQQYSTLKKSILAEVNFDFCFAIYNNASFIEKKEASGNLLYIRPSNFIRYTKNYSFLNNTQNNMLYNGFSYIGYVKDTNSIESRNIPYEFYELLACRFLRLRKETSQEERVRYSLEELNIRQRIQNASLTQ